MYINGEVYTIPEISKLYNITQSGVKLAIERGYLIEGVDCFKFGHVWAVYKVAADKLWAYRQ